jgi:hypothetical protein
MNNDTTKTNQKHGGTWLTNDTMLVLMITTLAKHISQHIFTHMKILADTRTCTQERGMALQIVCRTPTTMLTSAIHHWHTRTKFNLNAWRKKAPQHAH